MKKQKISRLIAILLIVGYLFVTLLVGIYQYRDLGGFTTSFKTTHLIIFIVSTILWSLKKQQNKEFLIINNIRSFASALVLSSLFVIIIFFFIEKGIVAIQNLF